MVSIYLYAQRLPNFVQIFAVKSRIIIPIVRYITSKDNIGIIIIMKKLLPIKLLKHIESIKFWYCLLYLTDLWWLYFITCDKTIILLLAILPIYPLSRIFIYYYFVIPFRRVSLIIIGPKGYNNITIYTFMGQYLSIGTNVFPSLLLFII